MLFYPKLSQVQISPSWGNVHGVLLCWDSCQKRNLIPPNVCHCINTVVVLPKQICSIYIWKYCNCVTRVFAFCFIWTIWSRSYTIYTDYVFFVKISKHRLRCSLCRTTGKNSSHRSGSKTLNVHLPSISYLENGISHLEVGLFSRVWESEWIACWQRRTVQISLHSKLQASTPATPHAESHQDNP